MRGERQVRRTTQYGEIFMRRVSPSSPLPGPSPRSRGEGSRHPAGALLLFLELLVL